MKTLVALAVAVANHHKQCTKKNLLSQSLSDSVNEMLIIGTLTFKEDKFEERK